MVQNVSDFKSRGRGRGTTESNIGRGTTGRGSWNNRGTPWKNTVNSRLNTIPEVIREDIKPDS